MKSEPTPAPRWRDGAGRRPPYAHPPQPRPPWITNSRMQVMWFARINLTAAGRPAMAGQVRLGRMGHGGVKARLPGWTC